MEDQKLLDAIEVVSTAINVELDRLREIAKDDEADPVYIAGTTTKGIEVNCMISGQLIAKIYLKYDCPIYNILGLDTPDEVWDELAELTGLRTVNVVDM